MQKQLLIYVQATKIIKGFKILQSEKNLLLKVTNHFFLIFTDYKIKGSLFLQQILQNLFTDTYTD